MSEKNRAREQASAQMESITEMVAAMGCDYDELETLREAFKDARIVGWNMPGYMPDSEPFRVDDASDAREALATEMEERADAIDEANDEGDLERHDEKTELREQAALLRDSDCEEYGRTIGNTHYWFTTVNEKNPQDDSELIDLEKAAGDCENEEQARERIQHDALEVQVRSDWHNPGEEHNTPSEFYILLCTGGPAVRIMGELDNHLQPSRAWIEYQDWATPWTEYHGENFDSDALLTYCHQFFFGE
jgi:hypothetical protein